MEFTDSFYPLHGGVVGVVRVRARRLSGVSQASEEDLLWMAIGFAEAIFCLGLICLAYLCYQYCKCHRVPNKIATPDLPTGETKSESDDGGESSRRLTSFFQNQHHNAPNADATSDVSQSDVWSFSLKSFSGMDRDAHAAYGGYEREDEEDQSYLEDSTFDASLYTSNGPIVERPPHTARRVGGASTVEI
eukprot:scaffold5684_cov169-Amphora_coffeaeformis.AAC.7